MLENGEETVLNVISPRTFEPVESGRRGQRPLRRLIYELKD